MREKIVPLTSHESSQFKSTARARLAGTLAQEILSHSADGAFLIASEHQLCQRFNISRVTVRLALADLEARGLIFRKHGKGTFAYGQLSRVHKSVGILMKTLPNAEHWPVSEMIRGVQSALAPRRANALLIQTSPAEWSPEMTCSLGGVLVFPRNVTTEDLAALTTRKVPFLFAWETPGHGAHIRLGQAEAAREMTERLLMLGHEQIAFVSGFEPSLDAAKREGVQEALRAMGKGPDALVEISLNAGESGRKAFQYLMNLRPRPTALIACDDGLAAQALYYARDQAGVSIPENLSVVSFHQPPFFHQVEPELTTVHFDFFEAGRKAAESLSLAALTGQHLGDIVLKGTYHAGRTLAAPSLSADPTRT